MSDVLMAKFTQHDELKKILLSTNESILIEHTENDDSSPKFFRTFAG